jgi:hypothetical protein
VRESPSWFLRFALRSSASCGGGAALKREAPTHTIGGGYGPSGTGLVLQKNNGGSISFGRCLPSHGLTSGAAYSVTVLAQPTNPSQTCAVTSGGSGTVASANVANVVVTCVTNTYTISGTVSGLGGTGLVLQNNRRNLPLLSDHVQLQHTIASGANTTAAFSANPPTSARPARSRMARAP